jgi:hypothetical protein
MAISNPAERLRPSSVGSIWLLLSIRLTRNQSSVRDVPSQSPANPDYTTVGKPPHRADTCNVVIFGESGAGKSSLVNLITRTNTAATSSDAGGCTSRTNAHEIWIRDMALKVKLFDTAGWSSSPLFVTVTELDGRSRRGSSRHSPR